MRAGGQFAPGGASAKLGARDRFQSRAICGFVRGGFPPQMKKPAAVSRAGKQRPPGEIPADDSLHLICERTSTLKLLQRFIVQLYFRLAPQELQHQLGAVLVRHRG